MNRLTTLALLVLVIGLGVAVMLQAGREDPDLGQGPVPLFGDLQTRRLVSIRLDNIPRSTHMGLEREQGRWRLIDPIDYPVRTEYLVSLLRAVTGAQARRVPPSDLESANQGLDPPRAVLELTEQLPDGSLRKQRIEMGDVDLDGMSVYVRKDGRVYRTLRNLETMLEHSINDWRSRKLFDLDHSAVVEVHRTGFNYLNGVQMPLELQAQRQGAGWWFDRPVRLQADPGAMAIWTQVLASMTLDRFVSDVADPDLSRYGLDHPWFSLTLTDRSGLTQTLHVAGPSGTYFCKRDDLPHVWELDLRELPKIQHDVLELFDGHLARIFRRDVEFLHLAGPGHTLRLTQDREAGEWTVSHQDPDGEWTLELPANRSVVERVLGVFEQEEILDYDWDSSVEDIFPSGSPYHGVWLESGGLRYGGRLGPLRITQQGNEVYPYHRQRESRVALVPRAVAELLELTPLDFESLLVFSFDAQRTAWMTLAREGRTPREYQRTVQGIWVQPEFPDHEAQELWPVIEQLVHLLAERRLAPDEHVELEDVVTVRIGSLDRGDPAQVQIGRTPEGEVRARRGARQAVLRSPELHELLLEIVK